MAYKLIDAAQPVGARSMQRTWSPWSAPAPSSTKANCSNVPSTSRLPRPANQPKRSRLKNTPVHRLDNISMKTWVIS